MVGGGGGVKGGTEWWEYMKTCVFCAFMDILNMKAQKHACFHVHVNSPFSAYFSPITS